MMTRRSTVPALTLACLCACKLTAPQDPKADDPMTLNASPQAQYPELTLEAQAEAMKRMEADRKERRIDDLRAKLAPIDWIETAYHGLVLDANLDVIVMDLPTVTKMQESLFSILYPPVREQANKHYGGDLEKLFGTKGEPKEQLVVRNAVLAALLEVSGAKLRERYEWRFRLLRGGANALIDWSSFKIPQALLDELRRLFDDGWIFPATPSSDYVESCRAEGVPIPPDWPDPLWIDQGALVLVFISLGRSARVHSYRDPAVPGVCYALPRTSSGGSIELLGIICESETTGKACFWDNRTVADAALTGPDLHLDIDTIGNGSTLGENCTTCHRGYNVFNIHPGSALDLTRDSVVFPPGDTSPWDTSPAVRYTPIGQPHWSNPGPLVLPTPISVPLTVRQLTCNGCHELPQTAGSSYCSDVLQNAALYTMPPFGPTRAGWPPGPILPEFADHITRLSTCP